MEKVHVDGKIIMNKKCIYYETCYESHTEVYVEKSVKIMSRLLKDGEKE